MLVGMGVEDPDYFRAPVVDSLDFMTSHTFLEVLGCWRGTWAVTQTATKLAASCRALASRRARGRSPELWSTALLCSRSWAKCGAPKRKIPVTKKLMLEVYVRGGLDLESYDGALTWFAILMGFYFLLRSSEYLRKGGDVD